MTRTLAPYPESQLKSWEGCVLYAYDDADASRPHRHIMPGDEVHGTLTGGYGHTGPDIQPGGVYTQDQADVWFDMDIEPECEVVERCITVPLTDNQFGAAVSLVHNIGAAQFEKSTFVRVVNNHGDAQQVQDALNLFVNTRIDGKIVRSEGLVNRRNLEGAMWSKGQFVSSKNVVPTPPKPIWQHPTVVKIGTAIASGATGIASNVTSDNVRSAVDAANKAAEHWHQFGIIAGVLSLILVAWILFDPKKQ